MPTVWIKNAVLKISFLFLEIRVFICLFSSGRGNRDLECDSQGSVVRHFGGTKAFRWSDSMAFRIVSGSQSPPLTKAQGMIFSKVFCASWNGLTGWCITTKYATSCKFHRGVTVPSHRLVWEGSQTSYSLLWESPPHGLVSFMGRAKLIHFGDLLNWLAVTVSDQ